MPQDSVSVWVDLAQACHRGSDVHPEHPRRITAIVDLLQKSDLPLVWHVMNDLIIPSESLETLKWKPLEDGDCYETPYTAKILRRVIVMIHEAVDQILNKTIRCGFILTRPPGHHSDMSNKPQGFCHINNVWMAVERLALAGVEKISILDWDVHHGDGTEELVRTHRNRFPNMRFVSLHAFGPGIYPGTGDKYQDENILNIPLPYGTGEQKYVDAFLDQALPFLGKPDIVLISAGYDALRYDPMGYMKLEPDTYAVMTRQLKSLGCPVLFLLEGGYNPDASAEAVQETIRAWSLS